MQSGAEKGSGAPWGIGIRMQQRRPPDDFFSLAECTARYEATKVTGKRERVAEGNEPGQKVGMTAIDGEVLRVGGSVMVKRGMGKMCSRRFATERRSAARAQPSILTELNEPDRSFDRKAPGIAEH